MESKRSPCAPLSHEFTVTRFTPTSSAKASTPSPACSRMPRTHFPNAVFAGFDGRPTGAMYMLAFTKKTVLSLRRPLRQVVFSLQWSHASRYILEAARAF